MARPLRIEFPGALYHITSRGNAKQNIFFDEKDFTGFLAILEKEQGMVLRFYLNFSQKEEVSQFSDVLLKILNNF